MKTIELDIWKPNPEKPGYLQLDRRRTNGEVFDELKAGLKKSELMPDEYFSCPDRDAVIPRHRWVACYAVTGGSEGYYIHIEVLGQPGEFMRAQYYEHPQWKRIEETRSDSVCVRHSIALGKCFESMDKAQQIANFCAKALGA